jgi:superfamily II DNA/RNA helicase
MRPCIHNNNRGLQQCYRRRPCWPSEADLEIQTDAERAALESLIAALEGMDDDPKLSAIRYYLREEGWLELGCIIFSQYYDTARWVADSLAAELPGELIGLYAGADRSRLYRDGQAVGIARESLKRMVADHDIRIMVATDAACEGLNLQTLGTLINVDLPWNPTRLEQRIGRIKRFGQRRSTGGHAEPGPPGHCGREGLRTPLGADAQPLRPVRRPSEHHQG